MVDVAVGIIVWMLMARFAQSTGGREEGRGMDVMKDDCALVEPLNKGHKNVESCPLITDAGLFSVA